MPFNDAVDIDTKNRNAMCTAHVSRIVLWSPSMLGILSASMIGTDIRTGAKHASTDGSQRVYIENHPLAMAVSTNGEHRDTVYYYHSHIILICVYPWLNIMYGIPCSI